MSFQDLTGGGASVRQFRTLHRDVPVVSKRVSSNREYSTAAPPMMRSSYHRSLSTSNIPAPKPRRSMIVLHGRVQEQQKECLLDEDDTYDRAEDEIRRASPPSRNEFASSSIRTVLERKSVFSRLSHETQIFGRMVADLEALLAECGESPEAAWRARILMRSAQETDKELWNKLYNYEKTLYGSKEDSELRQAQTACMKLHRDFKRTHKSLVLTLSFFEKRQKAEISRLGAVGWSTGEMEIEDVTPLPPIVPSTAAVAAAAAQVRKEPVVVATVTPNPQPDEDFFDRAIREREAFDRAMRHRELLDINKKMHTVNEIYSQLAEVVEDQQEKIDDLEDDTDSVKFNVRAARQNSIMELFCNGKDSPPPRHCGSHKGGGDDIDWSGLFSCGNLAEAASSLKQSYGITPDEASDNSSYSDESPTAAEPETGRRSARPRSSRYHNDELLSGRSSSKTPRNVSSRRELDPFDRRSRKSSIEESPERSDHRSPREEDLLVDSGSSRRPRRSGDDGVGNSSSERRSRRRHRSNRQSNDDDDNNNLLRVSEDFHWMMPFETLGEDVKAVQGDLLNWGRGFITPNRRRKRSENSSKSREESY